VGVEVPQNKGIFMNILEVHGSNNGIFMNPAMRLEHQDDKYRILHEPEETYLARDSYPEKFYDDYWQEGVDDLNNQEVDIIVDRMVRETSAILNTYRPN
jgi:hypothetical protein